jgi:hypothetical protein
VIHVIYAGGTTGVAGGSEGRWLAKGGVGRVHGGAIRQREVNGDAIRQAGEWGAVTSGAVTGGANGGGQQGVADDLPGVWHGAVAWASLRIGWVS